MNLTLFCWIALGCLAVKYLVKKAVKEELENQSTKEESLTSVPTLSPKPQFHDPDPAPPQSGTPHPVDERLKAYNARADR